ncbi:hypothetical protein [Streptomyces sp. NPDC051132]
MLATALAHRLDLQCAVLDRERAPRLLFDDLPQLSHDLVIAGQDCT